MPTLQDGRAAIDQGNIDQARLIFQALLQENPRDPDAWLGLAEVVTDEDDKRVCYENVLKIDKNNRAAKAGLRSLEPKEDPLVAALASRVFTGADEDEEDGQETMAAAPLDFGDAAGERSETPLGVLVAVGLAISVVVFAVFGGVVFVTLNALR
jgi:thioredoxin-like negative regulator of GroEL